MRREKIFSTSYFLHWAEKGGILHVEHWSAQLPFERFGLHFLRRLEHLADCHVTLTLVLTPAFKYMVAQELPKISYLTLLDKYILLSFIVDVSRYVIEAIFLLIHIF